MNPIPQVNQFLATYPLLLPVISIWSAIWKGLALWKAARKEQKPWFIALLVINTVGLLEIIYLFVVPKFEKVALRKQK